MWSFENPASSRVWEWGPMHKLMSRGHVEHAYIDVCEWRALQEADSLGRHTARSQHASTHVRRWSFS
eukprot:5276900-Heterocapsa_arctica.AAC.1